MQTKRADCSPGGRVKINRVFVSGVLITHQLSDEAVGWFRDAGTVVDELIAFVDEERAAPDLHDKLRQLDARIVNTRAPEFYRADFSGMGSHCRGDWVLKIDYDEELSREWRNPRWREILESEFTHFWCPRHWVTTNGNYIASEPWWPDWQLRLFRNSPEQISFPSQLHETMRMEGPAGYLRTLAIHHHDLRLTSRAAREAKAAAYEKARPGNGLGFFYLYEDHQRPELPLPGASDFDPAAEILRMEKLSDEDVSCLALEPDPLPATLLRQELLWLDVKLTNRSTRNVGFGAPCAVNLAYHWLDAESREPVVFDGERTAILPQLSPGAEARFSMFIKAPEAAGDYVLQLTLVQEHARWLDHEGSPVVREFPVIVK